MLNTVLALAVLLASPTSVTAGQGGQSPTVQVQGNTYVVDFAEGGTMTLAQFIADCQRATGLTFHYSGATATALEGAQARLLGTMVIPKEEFDNFLKVILLMNSFVCSENGPDGMSVIQIDPIDQGDPAALRASSLLVPAEELKQYEDRPATLITTVVDLPNVDIRQLAAGMNAVTAYTGTQQMLPGGSSNTMVLTGLGSDVVALARTLKAVASAYEGPGDPDQDGVSP